MKIRKNVTFKISLGYILIALLSVVVFISSFAILGKNQKIDRNISDGIVPAVLLMKDMNMLLTEIKGLDNSWIYTPNAKDKERLRNIVEIEFQEIRKRIAVLKETSIDSIIVSKINPLADALDAIIADNHALMQKLASDESYGDDVLVDEALSLYEKHITPKCARADELISGSIGSYNESLRQLQISKQDSYTLLSASLLLMLVSTVGAGVVSIMISLRMIIKPLNKLKEVINALREGVIMELKEVKVEDEISEMQNSISSMLKGQKENANFAMQIGKGNYEEEFIPLSDNDQMGNALLEMRISLKENAEEERRRSWVTIGIARMSDILRKTDLNLADLTDEIIRFVVKYTGSNQGGIFILERDEQGENFLVLRACYAYERKKYIDKRVRLGEGLVGQCFLEGQVISMTQLPNNYIKITSGLGEATPRHLVIIPLKLNEDIYGVLEMASFDKYEEHMMSLLEKISESIASSISNVKVNERTKELLTQAQLQAESLKAQEEEMRQNMEELTATQEEMTRKEKEYLERIIGLERKLNVSNPISVVID